ncbi:hypothetical protein AB0B21_20510 [Streptomyces rimosus]|uniref:hypothetical protein n=1 Tax=Streptomyces rimosus TaxID=1927 RepID=UPI00051843EF|nr:hypothetical protein [Streptomyces rimosus]
MPRKRDYSHLTDQQLWDRAVDNMRCEGRAQAWGLKDQEQRFREDTDELNEELDRRCDEKLRAEGWDI